MREIPGPQAVPADLKQPLADFLVALADDEFVLGYWDSEWTGVAPILEEDVACSSIAQDEIGHARLYYELVAGLTGAPIDRIAYGRQPAEYRQVQLVERHRGDWAFTIARQFLYDTADQLRLEVWNVSPYLPLAQAVAKIQREEVYHQMHGHAWLQRLASTTDEARKRLETALESLWPDALGMFEEYPGEALLLSAGILPSSSPALRQEWLAAIAPVFMPLRLPFPVSETKLPPIARGQAKRVRNAKEEETLYLPLIAPRLGGRCGQHTQDFFALWEQMTMVYRLEGPQATW